MLHANDLWCVIVMMFRCLHDYVRFFTLRLDFVIFRVCLIFFSRYDTMLHANE